MFPVLIIALLIKVWEYAIRQHMSEVGTGTSWSHLKQLPYVPSGRMNVNSMAGLFVTIATVEAKSADAPEKIATMPAAEGGKVCRQSHTST